MASRLPPSGRPCSQRQLLLRKGVGEGQDLHHAASQAYYGTSCIDLGQEFELIIRTTNAIRNATATMYLPGPASKRSHR